MSLTAQKHLLFPRGQRSCADFEDSDQHDFVLPPCGGATDLKGPRVTGRLPLAGLFDELAEELVVQLRVGQAHLQGALGQRDMVVDGRSVDGHVDEELAGLRGEWLSQHVENLFANYHF